MSNEASIHCNLQIVKDHLEYRNYPTSFQADVATGKGPSPGAFLAITTGYGTRIDFTNLATPGLAIVRNFDDENYVNVGIVVGATFYPVFEVQAGEFYPYRFSRLVNQGIVYIKAYVANCEVSVEAFEV